MEVEDQSAFFVGRSVRAIAQAAHVGHVNEFLTKIATGSWPAILGTEGGYAARDVEGMARRRLGAFARGFAVRRQTICLGLIAETEANAVLVDLDRLAAMLTRLAGYGA